MTKRLSSGRVDQLHLLQGPLPAYDARVHQGALRQADDELLYHGVTEGWRPVPGLEPFVVATRDVGPGMAFETLNDALDWASTFRSRARDGQSTSIVLRLRVDLGYFPDRPVVVFNANLAHVRIDFVPDPAIVDANGQPVVPVPVSTMWVGADGPPGDFDPEDEEETPEAWRYFMSFRHAVLPYINCPFLLTGATFTDDGFVIDPAGRLARLYGLTIGAASRVAWPRSANFNKGFRGFRVGITAHGGSTGQIATADNRLNRERGIEVNSGAVISVRGGFVSGALATSGGILFLNQAAEYPLDCTHPEKFHDIAVNGRGMVVIGWGGVTGVAGPANLVNRFGQPMGWIMDGREGATEPIDAPFIDTRIAAALEDFVPPDSGSGDFTYDGGLPGDEPGGMSYDGGEP